MNPPPTKVRAPWQDLLTSPDLFADLSEIYSTEFFEGFVGHFDRNPQPFEVYLNVIQTAQAYVAGKWRKEAEKSKLLRYTGVHLIGAGLSARRLSEELAQVTKSERAAQTVQAHLEAVLAHGEPRPYARYAHRSALMRNGPQSRLSTIQELASALEAAIGEIIALPSAYDEEKDAKQRAFDFVTEANHTTQKPLPKNYPMEEAARAFRPLWEEFSSVAYRRGGYRNDIGGYNCKPGNALFAIITKLDSTVALSLAGTAIENIRTQSKGENRSD